MIYLNENICYTRITMENLNEEIILETLSFIVKNDDRISRYILDKFITKSFLFDESFNIIPFYLFENQLITIEKEERQTFISLTEKGINLYKLLLTITQKS
jgi:predicted transcriptional regulator